MRVLIATASRHGATEEIAAAIAETLRARGFDVTAVRVEEASDIEAFDAVVVGSAVYMGKWLTAARAFVDVHAEELAARSVWLFSSGPLGDPGKPDDEHAVDVHDVLDRIGPCEHRLFSGKLDRDRLGFGERAVTRVVHAPSGDFRDWSSIRAWANAIASSLLCLQDRTPA
jgi:menaquinone-dependent protoporphyrinogen oxidase